MSDIHDAGSFPEVPIEILDAINADKLAVFIGAGISRIAGLRGWEDLAKEIFNRAKELGCFTEEEANSIFTSAKDGSEVSKLDNKTLITASCEALLRQGQGDIFFELLKGYLTLDDEIKSDGDRIFKFLLNASALTLTTNADCLLHSYYPEDHVRWKTEDISEWNLDRDQLIHLHGCVHDRKSLVFTVDQYLNRYNDFDFISYISRVFKEKTVLFIGYGLNEFELLDYLLTKGSSDKPHYVIASYEDGQEGLAKVLGYYYARLGIVQIPFTRSPERGHGELADLLDQWWDEFSRLSNLPQYKVGELSNLLSSKPTNGVIDNILHLVGTEEWIEDRLFAEILRKDDAEEWLLAFNSHQTSPYLRPGSRWQPQSEIPHESGGVRLLNPKWAGLKTLEAVYSRPEDHRGLDDVVNKIITECENSFDLDNSLSTNYLVASQLCTLICLYPSNENTERNLDFLFSLVDASKDAQFILVDMLRYKNKIDKWPSRFKLAIFSRLINATPEDKLDMAYLKEEFNKTLNHQFTIDAPEDIIELCLESIEKLYTENPFQFSSMGSVSEEPYTDNFHEDKYDAFWQKGWFEIIWVTNCIQALDYEKARQLFIRLYNSDNTVFRRLSIYCLDFHYGSIGLEVLLDQSQNPFDEIKLHSELFRFLKNHAQDMSDTECSELCRQINSAVIFETERVIPKNTLRMNFFKLLGSQSKEALDLYIELIGYEQYVKGFLLPENVSKGSLSESGDSYYSRMIEPIYNEISHLSPPEVITKINEMEAIKQKDKQAIRNAFAQYLQENKEIVLKNIDSFLGMETGYLDTLFQLIQNIDDTELSASLDLAGLCSIIVSLPEVSYWAVKALSRSATSINTENALKKCMNTLQILVEKGNFEKHNDPDNLALIADARLEAIEGIIALGAELKRLNPDSLDWQSTKTFSIEVINKTWTDWRTAIPLCKTIMELENLMDGLSDAQLMNIFCMGTPQSVQLIHTQLRNARFFNTKVYQFLRDNNFVELIISNHGLGYYTAMIQEVCCIVVFALSEEVDTLQDPNSGVCRLLRIAKSEVLQKLFEEVLRLKHRDKLGGINMQEFITLASLKAMELHENNELVFDHSFNQVSFCECLSNCSAYDSNMWKVLELVAEKTSCNGVHESIWVVLNSGVDQSMETETFEVANILVNTIRYWSKDNFVAIKSLIDRMPEDYQRQLRNGLARGNVELSF